MRPTLRQVRLASGLTLFVFVSLHLANHAAMAVARQIRDRAPVAVRLAAWVPQVTQWARRVTPRSRRTS